MKNVPSVSRVKKKIIMTSIIKRAFMSVLFIFASVTLDIAFSGSLQSKCIILEFKIIKTTFMNYFFIFFYFMTVVVSNIANI